MGRFPQALRWLSKGRRLVEGPLDDEARRVSAQLDARYASALQAQGRNRETIAMATRAIEAGEPVGAAEALGDAENMLAAALAILGRPGAIEHWRLALQHFEEASDLPGQAMVLSNLGAGEYWEGRWTEALDLYRRARDASERLGDPAVRAQNEMNIAEVLVDQGSPVEAEELLRSTSRVWRALGDDYLLGWCLTQIGRIAGVMARTEDAIATFEQAREIYRATGAPGQIVEVDLREAEARLLAGDHAWLLERRQAIADELAADEGVNVLQPLLDRLVGYALAQTGAVEDSVDAFERGAQGARDRGADHDLAMALQGLARMARLRGEDPVPYERESGEICERLGIIAVLTFPIPASR